MAEQVKTQVTRIYANPQLTRIGGVEQRVSVEFLVGDHGPFTVTLPEAEFTDARVRAEMEKKAVEIRKLTIS